MPKIVLVTGLIGSGKSAVCKILSDKGFPVYDSDSRTKALYRRQDIARKVECEIGVDVDHLKGIFETPDKLHRLEEIIHPEVLKDFKAFAAGAESPVVFFESAIAMSLPLFAGQFDKVILVRASKEKRWTRNPKAASRDAFQSEPAHYDFLIENDGSLKDLEEKTELIISQL